MARRAQRVAFAIVGGLLALGTLPATGAVATAAPPSSYAGACTDGKGITVIVDATAFGDGVQVRCAPQPVQSGFHALTKAGFAHQGTVRFPGLLCRIDGEPASDPCHGAPPADAYWAYSHAPRGGDWTYSTSGAGSRKPPPGSVEGWAFGNGAEPGADPPAPPATTTTQPPTTTTRPSASSGGGATPPPSGSGGGSAPTIAGGTDTGSASPTEGDSGSTSTTSDEEAAATSDGSDGDELAGVPTSADGGSDGGSPLGLVIGIAVAAGLGVAAIRSARRRRGAGQELA